MIDASMAKKFTEFEITKNIAVAKDFIESNPSKGWDWLTNQFKSSCSYSRLLKEVDILEQFGDNPFWTKERIYNSLIDLNFRIGFSFSSNMANETWKISWKK